MAGSDCNVEEIQHRLSTGQIGEIIEQADDEFQHIPYLRSDCFEQLTQASCRQKLRLLISVLLVSIHSSQRFFVETSRKIVEPHRYGIKLQLKTVETGGGDLSFDPLCDTQRARDGAVESAFDASCLTIVSVEVARKCGSRNALSGPFAVAAA